MQKLLLIALCMVPLIRLADSFFVPTPARAVEYDSSLLLRLVLQSPSLSTSSSKIVLSGASNSNYEPLVPNYCAECGAAAMELKIPEGDEHIRAACSNCHAVCYSNPKVVVSCVLLDSQNRCLMGKRAIEPRKGFWGIPQGYMEHGETTREAAIREVREETGLSVVLEPHQLKLCAVYNVPGTVQLVYKAQLSVMVDHEDANDMPLLSSCTTENTEISFVSPSEIGLSDAAAYELCFPTVQWAIDHCLSGSDHIQQKTKLFDASTKLWTEQEEF
mmetsp:Transcript_14758/g.19297  ORF Transcript_14758/g.19297 Transcript_14758/m.19297 type:complete len:274 (-) Transcript_14758:312-1133(-)|eukprot:CAMPEP_0198146878 /NCGR_PEP_ID=MMETSP1443-20131203/32030_1 /TAXON_ID=186043 /ORGANISM="Entomoneis sp., Strain CCMP2396" /LENGTH=273 /DNA_ID=CAMNT_0043810981 /DNA_START=82 /DNA_END=903 /DNA_ORIENTATION=+